MILIDSNALVVLILGLIDENLIGDHKRASIYTAQDYRRLIHIIKDFKNLLVLPQVWAETDNLLNNFTGDRKYRYFNTLKMLITETTEQYLQTKTLLNNPALFTVGVTDSLLLEVAKDCKFLITADSMLSDLANAKGIRVYDMVEVRNRDFI